MAQYTAAVVGCGGIGCQHAEGLVGLDNVRLAAGCDLNPRTREEFKARFQDTWAGIALYDDYRQMLEAEKPDILTIATPDNVHARPVLDAVEAGVKAIFCEKPLATSLEDARAMRQAVNDAGVLFSVDHTRRWTPAWRRLRELLAEGAVGEVQYLVGTLSGKRGSLFRNGTHLIDALCYLAGARPQWVFAELERGYEDHTEYRGDGGADPSLEPSASGYIHFANGVRAFYTGTSKKTAGPKWHFEIVGSKGKIVGNKELFLQRDGKTEPIAAPEPANGLTGIPAGVRELAEALDGGGTTSSPMEAAWDVVQVIFGFIESQRRGNARVDLPLEG